MITITAPAPDVKIGRRDDINIYVRAMTTALKRAVISMEFPGLGRTEEVHNGDNFLPPYLGSLRQAYTDGSGTGFSYLVRRVGGWPDGPIVRVVAYDVAGGDAII